MAGAARSARGGSTRAPRSGAARRGGPGRRRRGAPGRVHAGAATPARSRGGGREQREQASVTSATDRNLAYQLQLAEATQSSPESSDAAYALALHAADLVRAELDRRDALALHARTAASVRVAAHDARFARELAAVPEDGWAHDGDCFERPLGLPDSSAAAAARRPHGPGASSAAPAPASWVPEGRLQGATGTGVGQLLRRAAPLSAGAAAPGRPVPSRPRRT